MNGPELVPTRIVQYSFQYFSQEGQALQSN